MIGSFRHKGLERLYLDDDRKLLPPQLVGRIREILTALDAAQTIEGLNRPTFRLHPLKGDRKGFLGGRSARELAHRVSLCGRQGA